MKTTAFVLAALFGAAYGQADAISDCAVGRDAYLTTRFMEHPC